jgi:hypothetical protein
VVVLATTLLLSDFASARMTECEPGGCSPTPSASSSAGGGAATSGTGVAALTCSVPQCSACRTCERDARETEQKCTNISSQLTRCNDQMAAALGIAQGEVSESQVGLLQSALGVSANCLADVDQRIAMCRSLVSQCNSSCDSAESILETIRSTSTAGTPAYDNVLCKLQDVKTEQRGFCRAGAATVAQLEVAKQQIAQQTNQLMQAIMLLGPTLAEMIMSSLGSTATDLCAMLKRDLGEEHLNTQAACGPRYEPLASGDEEGESPDDTDFGAPGGEVGGRDTQGQSIGSQDFDGIKGNRNRNSSGVREQSVSAASSGAGGPAVGGGSSKSGPNSRYESAGGARGFNTNIMSDPEGRAGGGSRGTASQSRQQSQWIQGQQARSEAEAHRRAVEEANRRKREIRGPHAQGLFESVSETYRRYQHEMMQ